MNEKLKQWLKEVLHNCVVHPIMPFIPSKLACELHDRNADYTFGKQNRFDEIAIETAMKENDLEKLKPLTSPPFDHSFLDQLKQGSHCDNKEVWKEATELCKKYPIRPDPLIFDGPQLVVKCDSNS